jgi:two-component system OmpR family sensor kinase
MPFNSLPIRILVHDLKNPMAVIMAGARSLLERPEVFGGLSDKQQKVIERILRNAVKGNAILNDVAEFELAKTGVFRVSQLNPLSTVRSALVEAVEEVQPETAKHLQCSKRVGELAAALRELQVEMNISPNFLEAEVFQDEAKLRQIMRTLILTGFHCRRSKLTLTLDKRSDTIFLSVASDGPGAEPRGVGIMGVKALVELMGGQWDIQTDPRKGTTSTISLPCRAKQNAAPTPALENR